MGIGRLLAALAPVVLAAALVVPAAADTAPAPTLYVRGGIGGCDNDGPGSYSDPLCDIQTAANVAVPGQTVIVDANGLVNDFIGGDVHITRSGAPGAPIVFETGGGTPETGLPSTVVIDSGTNGFVLDGVHDVTVRGFGIENTTSTGIVISNSSDVTIDHDFLELAPQARSNDGIDISGTSSDDTVSRSSIDTDNVDVSIGPGVQGTDVAQNIFRYGELTNAVSVTGATNTDIVNNTAAFTFCPASLFSVTGGSTGTSLENNIFKSVCTMGNPLLTVAPDSTASTKWDYNIVDDQQNDAAYFWGGVAYGQASALAAAVGQGVHDSDAPLTLKGTGYVPVAQGAAVDSADANAPGILPTDYNGHARADEPTTPNTGTGIGDVDRGAVELQDPMTVSVTMNTSKAPTGGTVVATIAAKQGWAPITGYSVDFGDGTPPTSSTSPTISHVYGTAQDAPYPIAATVTDSLGNTAAAFVSIFSGVKIVPPASLVPVLKTGVYQPNTLEYFADMSASTDSWSLVGATCDFGDGTGVQSTDQLSCDHTYQTSGVYKVTMTVTDAAGNTATASTQLVARLVPPAQPGPGNGGHCPTCY